MLRIPHWLDGRLTDGGGVVTPTHQPHSTPVKLTYNSEEWCSEMLRHMALVRTDVSEELGTSFIRVTRIGELGTMLAETSNRHPQRLGASVASYS
jgi:hypothetical protein